MEEKNNIKKIGDEVSFETQKKLVAVLSDAPTICKLGESGFPITRLKYGTKWKICESVIKYKTSNEELDNVIVAMFDNIPILLEVITYAVLNSKERIEKEFEQTYDYLLWNLDDESDVNVLFTEILKMLDTRFFFANIELTKTFLRMTSERKLTAKEQKQLHQEQSSE